MTKTSAKVIDQVAEAAKNMPVTAKVERNVTHYIGCYSDTKNSENIIKHIQSNDCFPNLKYINHRPTKDGKRTQVWLSNYGGEYTINGDK